MTNKAQERKIEDKKEPEAKQVTKEVEELKDLLQRLQADFENYKKRIDKEKEQIKIMTAAKLIGQLLPVLDTFSFALGNTKEHDKFVKGIELTYAQLYHILENYGLKPIPAVGVKLDPAKHEVLLHECRKDCEEDTILEEIQKGYMLNEHVIRSSKVKVAKHEKHDNKSNTVEQDL